MSNTQLQIKEVELFLNQCGLSQYFQVFVEEGFEKIESLLEVTETDLIQMQVKRGHRRLLQRAMANSRGIPSNIPLNITPTAINYNIVPESANPNDETIPCSPPIPSNTNSPVMSTLSFPVSSQKSPQEHDYHPSAGTMNTQSMLSSTEEEAVTSDNVHKLWKRKYHRHPKSDTNAPLKPPSAYVMFSNDTRAELKQQNKSFTDMAKIIGDRWKSISPEEKDLYELNALSSRESYQRQTGEYQKTESYKIYQQYLSDFKAKNEAVARPVGRPRKRQNNKSSTDDGRKPQNQYPFYLLNGEDTNNSDNLNNNIPSRK